MFSWLKENGTREKYVLPDREITIGRAASNHLVLKHPSVSKFHVKIYKLFGSYFISELYNTPGVVINGEWISEMRLRDGDQIKLGEIVLQYCESDEIPHQENSLS